MITGTIILEGGAARGIFTAGVLDYLMDRNVYFSDVIGISAGACNGVNYVAKQKGRTKQCLIHEDGSFKYMNLRKFVKSKSLMDMDTIFDTFPNETFPFDYDTYFASKMDCLIGVTNCNTGKVEFLKERENRERLMRATRASSSLPLVAPIVNIDGFPYLDGGLSDSVPILKAQEIGHEKMVVVLTQNPGHRKLPMSKGMARLYARHYHKYPELVKSMRRRTHDYNVIMDYIDELEKTGEIFVIRPQVPTVDRMESDAVKLTDAYDHGVTYMESQYDNLMKYLGK